MKGLTQLLLIVGVLTVRTALALNPERHITEFAHRFWSSREGAPTDIVGLAQTTDGYLWLASNSGLYRFDGTQFQPFEPLSGLRLPTRQINSVFASQDSTLWIGYRDHGVGALQAGRLVNYTSVNGFPEGRVYGFAQDREGRIWAASSRGLARFEGGRWRAVGNELNFPGLSARAVLVDHLGAVWVAGDHRIAVLSPGSSTFELTDEPYNGQVVQLVESPDGTVWMTETTRAVRPVTRPGQGSPFHGLGRADCQSRFPETWQTERRCQRPDDLEVRVGSRAVLFDSNGSLWITTLGDGLRRAAFPSRLRKAPIGEFDTVLEQFTSQEGLSADYVTNILEDREGDIWVSTSNGIDQFRPSDLAPINLGPTSDGFSMAPGDEGYVFVAAGVRVLRFRDGHEKPVVVDANAGTTNLHRDPLGSIWSADVLSACRLVEHHCINEVELPAGRKGPSAETWRFAVDENRRGWAYLENNGLFVRENGHWSPVTDVPSGAIPRTQFTDASGQIWFGLSNGQLVSVTNGRVRTYSSDDGLTVGGIKAIDSLGAHVWVGGEGGVALLRGPRFTSIVPADAAAFDSVSGVVEADDGSLWLVEHRGIIRIPAAEVGRILQSAAYRAHYEVLNYFDGLPGDAQSIRRLPAAIRGTDGRLWFAAAHGVAWVNPRQLYHNSQPPPVSIQTIVADGHLFAPSAPVELPGTTTNLQIAYAGLSLSVPERVQFRYRLRGLDQEWQSVGTRRTAYYTRLPPGSYDFQVIASNDAGVWNDVGAELRIHILRAWYQTLWFRSVCATVLVGLLWAAYQLRLRQIARVFNVRLEERVAERTRIARELHDTLLQSFQGLLLRFQTAYALFDTRPADAKEVLRSSIDQTAQAVTEGREAVQGLRASTVESNDLAQAITTLGEQLAAEVGSATSVGLHVAVEGTPRNLHPIVRDEVYRVASEALRNAFRHAEAQQIELEFRYDERNFRLRVRDDGKGIDVTFLGDGRRGHFGLHGMRERAKLMGGSLAVWTAAESGTEIELIIPAARAYASPRGSWLADRFSGKSEQSK
jgi:signal transduction histidine kinase/ligand-binding sensor domain-containing protein